MEGREACLRFAIVFDVLQKCDCSLRKDLREVACRKHLNTRVGVVQQRFKQTPALRHVTLYSLNRVAEDVETTDF